MMSTTAYERRLILETCARLRPRRILEIGVFQGETTSLLAGAAAAWNGQVLGIDPMTWAAEWLGNGVRRHLPARVGRLLLGLEAPLGAFGYERRFWARVGEATNVALVRAKSTDPDLLASPDPRLQAFDLVFIDGDHSYESIRSDLANWGRRVRPGGCVLVHDVAPRFRGVCRAVREWADASPVAVQWPRRDSLCVAEVVGEVAPARAA